MLKANKVQAVALQLKDGGQAVLVQDGPAWNGLRKFKCIAPPQCDGLTVIATKDQDGNSMAAMFGEIFNLEDGEKWVVLMSSPDLTARLQQ
jgi:hypothetical protein